MLVIFGVFWALHIWINTLNSFKKLSQLDKDRKEMSLYDYYDGYRLIRATFWKVMVTFGFDYMLFPGVVFTMAVRISVFLTPFSLWS